MVEIIAMMFNSLPEPIPSRRDTCGISALG
jgi:hypothetical protein